MQPFKYSKANDVTATSGLLTANPKAKILAGGTNILDLMKEDVERPEELIDITNVPLTEIKNLSGGANSSGVSIGATAKNTDTQIIR